MLDIVKPKPNRNGKGYASLYNLIVESFPVVSQDVLDTCEEEFMGPTHSSSMWRDLFALTNASRVMLHLLRLVERKRELNQLEEHVRQLTLNTITECLLTPFASVSKLAARSFGKIAEFSKASDTALLTKRLLALIGVPDFVNRFINQDPRRQQRWKTWKETWYNRADSQDVELWRIDNMAASNSSNQPESVRFFFFDNF